MCIMDVCTEHLYNSFSKAEVFYKNCGKIGEVGAGGE